MGSALSALLEGLPTKSNVKEIPENTTGALDYFLEFMARSCSVTVYIPQAYGQTCPHAPALAPTLAHTHAHWGKGRGAVLWG